MKIDLIRTVARASKESSYLVFIQLEVFSSETTAARSATPRTGKGRCRRWQAFLTSLPSMTFEIMHKPVGNTGTASEAMQAKRKTRLLPAPPSPTPLENEELSLSPKIRNQRDQGGKSREPHGLQTRAQFNSAPSVNSSIKSPRSHIEFPQPPAPILGLPPPLYQERVAHSVPQYVPSPPSYVPTPPPLTAAATASAGYVKCFPLSQFGNH